MRFFYRKEKEKKCFVMFVKKKNNRLNVTDWNVKNLDVIIIDILTLLRHGLCVVFFVFF